MYEILFETFILMNQQEYCTAYPSNTNTLLITNNTFSKKEFLKYYV